MATGTDYKNLTNTATKKTALIYGKTLIRNELEMLFSLEKYSLFFGNDFGLDLNKYLSLTNRAATFNLIKADIEDTLRKYGKVTPTSLNMRFDEAENSIVIDLTVSLTPGGNSLVTIPITVSN
jgi:hypothetical protein